MPRTRRAWISLLLLLAGLAALSAGCAYFNTFANAKKFFREGENTPLDARGNLPPSARRSFDECVAKCQKVIDEYPDSRWVDDAYFLMSKAYFQKKEYGRCLARLDELDRLFPENEFAEESLYMRGVCHLEREDEARAIAAFQRLEEGFPGSEHLAEGMFRGAEAEYRLGNWDKAIEGYGRLLDSFEKSDWNDEARLKRGMARREQKDHRGAADELALLAERGGDRGTVFEGQVLRVRSLMELREHEKADSLLGELESVADFFQRRGEVMLLMAEIRERENELDRAIPLLENVASEFPNTPEAAEALYRIGIIRQVRQGDSEAALEAFQSASEQAGGSVYGGMAQERRRALEEILSVRESLESAEGDSTAAEARFRLAENQLLLLGDSRAALDEYRGLLEEFPDSPWAPRAAYALCYIYRYEMADTLAALGAADRLMEDYPESEPVAWVRGWRAELGGAP